MKSKFTLLIGLLVIASVVLSACGGGGAAPTAAATEGTVTIWHQWSGDYQPGLLVVPGLL
jgi:ABC-type glycerol-3-phosphate transport system substrate-binding protein